MASAKPINEVVPRNLTPTSTSGAVSQVNIKLTNEDKRHAVVGIALSTVLIPTLRNYVDKKLTVFYNTLVEKHKVNSPESDLFRPSEYGFQYDDQNNYIINNHNELAKLYLKKDMAKQFKTITDETTDASALLGIMGWASCFKKESDLVHKIRQNVRNQWGHCNMSEWTQIKFFESFQLMIELMRILPNHVKEKENTIKSLVEWQEDGLKLLGKHIDPELLKRVYIEFQRVLEIFKTEKADTHALEEQKIKIETAANKLKEVELKVKKVEAEQIDIKSTITNHESRIESLEKKKGMNISAMYSIPNRNTCFSGRGKELNKIIISLEKECQIFAICGLGGVGKTSLALEVAWG